MRAIRALGALVIAAAATVGMGEALADPRFMPTAGPATSPPGFVDFCRRHSEECDQSISRGLIVQLDDARLLDLTLINRSVNAQIAPATDRELYGVEEYWTLPVERGDCEDYVLLKRRQLMRRGWPASALLITVVRDENGEGHAVLTVRTNRGELVLDNKVDVIRTWAETRYTYIKRQATTDARRWVRIDPVRADAAVASIRR